MVATSSNRRQYSTILETTLGTTPTPSPRMRQRLVTGDSLNYGPTFVDSSEMRSDRSTSDSIVVGVDNNGGINWEFHYPLTNSWLDWDIRSAFANTWTSTPERDNDGTADSVITDIGTVANTLTCTTGSAFVIGHLVRTTGFTASANNTVVKVTTGGATSYVATGSGYTADAAPAAAARAKVVGCQGASGDIVATSTGLTCTALSFTGVGISVGQWLKIGGTATGDKFATAANNARVRVTAVSATAITLDNLPTGWGADAGTGKTIKIWFGDKITNGTTVISQSIEIGDLAQTTPNYMLRPGMIANQWQISCKPKQIITGTTTFSGMGGGTVSTTSVDSTIDSAPSQALFPQFAGSANVGRVAEFGSLMTTPNWCVGFDLTINNNVNPVETLDALGPQDLVENECTITGTLMTIYGDSTVLARYLAGTATSINISMSKLTQMVFITLPRVELTGDGNPQASGKNTIIDVNFQFKASRDDTYTNAMVQMDRLEYFE